MEEVMTIIQEKIERLKREKTVHSTEELACLGWARYADIRDTLEVRYHGDYVMLEVDSGEYVVGKTSQEALRRAEVVYPHKAFYVIRIGYKAAHKLKRGWSKGL